jgi:hypothetical protein
MGHHVARHTFSYADLREPSFAFASPPAATYVSLAAILKDCAVPNLEFPVSPGGSKA